MTKRTVLISLRLMFGLLALAALGKQFSIQLQHGFSILNFWSYFTNLANLFASVVLILGAYQLFFRREPSASEGLIRGAAAVNMGVVGIVFTILLRDVDLGHLLPWVNTVLHYVMPVAVLLDWLLQPPQTKLGGRPLLLWQVFPLLYLTYVLLRGSMVGWYPYPFLDFARIGVPAVAAYVLGIVVVFLFVSWLLLKWEIGTFRITGKPPIP